MTQRLIYAALSVLALSVPAAAQGYEPRGYEPRGYEPRSYEPRGYEPGAMPPYEVFTMLRSAGLDPVGAPARRGPNYVLRAFDRSDREVRVVVDARSGDILSVRPIAMASREQPLPPRGGMGAYERMPPGYVPRDTYRGGSNARPSIDDDDDDAPPPRGYSPRPQGMTPGPGTLPRSSNAVPPRNNGGNNGAMRPRDNDDIDVDVDVDIDTRSAPQRDPSVIRADPERSGMLPPPPERFPQRAAPAAPSKPKPVQPAQRSEPVQRSAAAPPKQAPLPKPKPSVAPSVSSETPPPAIQSPPAKWEDPPAPLAPAKSPSTDDTPH